MSEAARAVNVAGGKAGKPLPPGCSCQLAPCHRIGGLAVSCRRQGNECPAQRQAARGRQRRRRRRRRPWRALPCHQGARGGDEGGGAGGSAACLVTLPGRWLSGRQLHGWLCRIAWAGPPAAHAPRRCFAPRYAARCAQAGGGASAAGGAATGRSERGAKFRAIKAKEQQQAAAKAAAAATAAPEEGQVPPGGGQRPAYSTAPRHHCLASFHALSITLHRCPQ